MICLILLLWIFWTVPAFADDVVVCNTTHPVVPNAVTRFESRVAFQLNPSTTDSVQILADKYAARLSGLLVWDSFNFSMTPQYAAFINSLRGQLDSLVGVPTKYWVCVDGIPIDGILDGVQEMSQAQKNALDASQVAEQARQDALNAERISLEVDVDAAFTNWSTLTAAQRLEALRKSMRLNRVERLLNQ